MNESTTPTTKQFSGCASLAAIGIKLRELKVFQPIEQTVQMAQKTIKDSPTDKLYDAFISLLAGARQEYFERQCLIEHPRLLEALAAAMVASRVPARSRGTREATRNHAARHWAFSGGKDDLSSPARKALVGPVASADAPRSWLHAFRQHDGNRTRYQPF